MHIFKSFRHIYHSVPSDEKLEREEDIAGVHGVSDLLEPHRNTLLDNRVPKAFFRAAELFLLVASVLMFMVGLSWQLRVDDKCFKLNNFYSSSVFSPFFSTFSVDS